MPDLYLLYRNKSLSLSSSNMVTSPIMGHLKTSQHGLALSGNPTDEESIPPLNPRAKPVDIDISYILYIILDWDQVDNGKNPLTCATVTR